ncbi:MAG: hypothetical protein RSD82_01930, partial [Comamonas sp.]
MAGARAGKIGAGLNSTAGHTLTTWHSNKSEGLAITACVTGGQRSMEESNAVLAKVGWLLGSGWGG